MNKKKPFPLFDDGRLSVSEAIDKKGGCLCFVYGGQVLCANYSPDDFYRFEAPCPKEGYYAGYTYDQVMDSGRDILAEKALEKGEASFETLIGLLPPLRKNAYSFLSGAVGWSGVVVDMQGNIYPQMNGQIARPAPIFTPVELDVRLNHPKPQQMRLESYVPVMVSVYEPEVGTQIRTIAFVEHGDPDRDPLVWMRATWYVGDRKAPTQDWYFCVTQSRDRKKQMIASGPFWNALYTTIIYWRRFVEHSAAGSRNLCIPDKELETLVRGTLISCASTFTGEHPHYGHKEYGSNQHDNFPPTLISAFESAAVWGQTSRARGMVDHLMKYSVDAIGRFSYRQGDTYDYGAAAVEYGQLLWVLGQYWQVMERTDDLEGMLETLRHMGDILIGFRMPMTHDAHLRLIRACAEADTHERVYYYVNNNLWAVRGLQSLSTILKRQGADGCAYEIEARSLLDDVRAALERYRVPTQFGQLVPFQFYYSATPLTLSNTKATFYPVSPEEYGRYIVPLHMSEDIDSKQEYSENTYANYRYYVEMLSTRLLELKEEEAIVKMREGLGGELLGMTRFLDRLDDWPVFNYARYLLETDRIDKYLLILYAHALYSGCPRHMIYFEQFTADGTVVCPDCVPALLNVPLLTAWMFAHVSTVDGTLHLLHGVPQRWYAAPEFYARDIVTPCGAVSVSVKNAPTQISLEIALSESARAAEMKYVHIRGIRHLQPEQIINGSEWVQDIRGDALLLKDDCPAGMTIQIRRRKNERYL
jgi:hypothetical protein